MSLPNVENLISKDFRLFEVALKDGDGPFLYRYDELMSGIKKWTNILLSATSKKNPTVGINHDLDLTYFSVFYACINIGATFVILDGIFNEQSKHKEFLPIDIVITNDAARQEFNNKDYWPGRAHIVINSDHLPEWSVKHADPLDMANLPLLKLVSSGTTGTPKKLAQNYDFFFDVARRNTKVFNFNKGRVAHVKVINHTGTVSVFFLPAVMDNNFHYIAPWPQGQNEKEILENLSLSFTKWIEYLDINHIILPYIDMNELLLKSINECNAQFTDLTLYALTYIRPEWAELIKGRNIKIVSVFGSSETSGPVFLNYLDNTNLNTFDSTIFYSPDDYYNLTLLPDGTRVQNQYIDVVMNDRFKQIGENKYQHLGRSDKNRINDIDIDLSEVLNLAEKLGFNGQLVFDKLMGKIYLAMWDNKLDIKKIEILINKKLEIRYTKLVQISKSAVLDKNHYMSGIKVDMESLRIAFRTF